MSLPGVSVFFPTPGRSGEANPSAIPSPARKTGTGRLRPARTER